MKRGAQADERLLGVMLARRIVVADHRMDDVYLVALHDADDAEAMAAAEAWIDGTDAAITATQQSERGQRSSGEDFQSSSHHLGASQPAAVDMSASSATLETREEGAPIGGSHLRGSSSADKALLFTLRHAREQYMEDVRSCLKVRPSIVLLSAAVNCTFGLISVLYTLLVPLPMVGASWRLPMWWPAGPPRR